MERVGRGKNIVMNLLDKKADGYWQKEVFGRWHQFMTIMRHARESVRLKEELVKQHETELVRKEEAADRR
jgi:hypothetical protein